MAEGVARLPLQESWSVCTCQHHVPWNVVLTSASTYSTFYFKLYSTIYTNYCRVQCHSGKESGLTWNQPQPHYDHFVVFSILLTKRHWQSSTSTRPVWQRQKSVMSRIQSTDHEEAIFDRQRGNIKMVNWLDCGGVQIMTARKCNIKHDRQLYSWLVLPPYTVKIRGGCLERIIEMSSCPTTQHS